MKKNDKCSFNDNNDLMKENINVQIFSSNIETSAKTSVLATTALRERRKTSLSVESKASSIIDTDNSGSKQSLQSGGSSSKESTISGRSSATPTQSLLTPPATSPTTPQVIPTLFCFLFTDKSMEGKPHQIYCKLFYPLLGNSIDEISS